MQTDRITTKQLQQMSRKQFKKFARDVIVPNKPARDSGITVKFPYDLRASLDMKTQDAHEGTRFTAFINNSGKLCHVVCPEAEFVIRVQFPYGIKHLCGKKQLTAVKARIDKWIKI